MYESQSGEMDYSNECPLAVNKNTCGDCPYGERIRTNEYICHEVETDEDVKNEEEFCNSYYNEDLD